ncbi:hypothetical protein D9M69_290400 [compost metagenome]
MVVGEGAVDVAVQRDHGAAQGLDQLRCDHPGYAVAAVHHHFQGPGHGDVVADFTEVAIQHVHRFEAADAAGQVVALDAGVQGSDLFVGQGFAGDHDLEAVVVRRVVAAGEHHAGFAGQHVGCVVERRGRHHADVADLATAVQQALDQRLDQLRAGQAAIAADRDVGLAAGQALGADGATDPVGGLGGEGIADHAADVIRAENAGGQGGGDLFDAGHGRGLLQSQEVLVFVEDVDIENVGILEKRLGRYGRLGGSWGNGVAGDRPGLAVVRRRLGFAPGLAGKRLGQVVQRRQAQTEGFDALAVREFLQHLIELLGVITQLALQRALVKLQAQHRAAQGEQRGQCQQQRGNAFAGQCRTGNEAELPVRIAAVQGDRRGVAGLPALGQHLGRGIVELLDQLQLASAVRQCRQAPQQAIHVEHQQQRALGGALIVLAQWRRAVDQPAFTHLVGFGAGLPAAFQATQQVQRGEVHRRGALAVLLGLAGQVEMGVDHAVAIAQAALGGHQPFGIAAVECVDQAWIAGGCGGIGLQLGDGLAQGGGLAVAPGLRKLPDPALLGRDKHAEPEQGAGSGHACEGSEHSREQVAGVLAARPSLGRGAGCAVAGGVLAALEEFH